MSDFKVEIMRVDAVEKHPDADRLKIVKIKGFNCISGNLDDGSARYKEGDLVVYIPEGAVLPEPMLRACGFWDEANSKGLMAGTKGDRVKAVRLRGIVSQGILYPVVKLSQTEQNYLGSKADGMLVPPRDLVDGYTKHFYVSVGDDVAEHLQIVKYIPPVPESMSGDVVPVSASEAPPKFDIENIQKYPSTFTESTGEVVVVTEKLHGTFCGLAFIPDAENQMYLEGKFYAFSKGLGNDGLVFQDNEKNRLSNIYHKTLVKYLPNFKQLISHIVPGLQIFVLGEVYGKGIQDLQYGTESPQFRVFDLYVRDPETGTGVYHHYLGKEFESVPLLYYGPYYDGIVGEMRDGKSTLCESQIREGIVIKAFLDRHDDVIGGRAVVKAVSPAYLLRKGNVTEFN